MDDPETRFTDLYDRHYRAVLGYALLRAERAAAEDVAGETFLIAWRRFADLPPEPLPWLLGVARNLLRKQRDSGIRAERLLAYLPARAAPDVADQVTEREAALIVLAAMAEADAEALILTSWYGLTPREAAKIAGCATGTFTVRLHRARRRLTEALRPRTLQEQS
ncbi:sigma-70 family RNA polymerase sigma factor [Herbidospora sp. NBRC 101105]|uniref:RNA polymerase sigma factor n=1 Tax=Herbidospora sp. NBRC 101105 TaxID=3032195 RepID=UPI0024A0A963|nr:sigma-70 family RNA polymerase sigma factor [Herbidospora sp. NBRC 101105]GLX97928.1 DNA-directed RNA polymerase sigma-70 factor [Herbidospora sp. NBRC 101105]